MMSQATGTAEAAPGRPEPELVIGQRERLGPSPVLAAFLGLLVAVAVFLLILRIRRAFGMK
jgi:hypothetical protein